MALNHVVDTSVLTRLRHPEVRGVIEPLVSAGEVGRVRISDLEVGVSARNAHEWDRLMGALAVFEVVEIEARHVERARQVQRMLAEKGLRGRKIPDLLVAAAAEERGLGVLHYDADFELIADATGQRVAWVVQRGNVD